jgi:hypothetical protein
MRDIVEREHSPKPNRNRANIKPEDLFQQSKPAIPTAGKVTALERAQAYVDRGERDAYVIACKTYMTKEREPVSGLPRPTPRFIAFVEKIQEQIDNRN